MADFISRNTDLSKASVASQKILDDVSEKSSSKLYQLQGLLSEDTVSQVWSSFGLHVSKQLRSGRSVKVPHFGLFTFTNPEVTLPGVTNPEQRDKQFREPVFIIIKEFLNGLPIQSGMFTDQGVRAINLSGMCGNIQTVQANFIEIADSASCSKENVRLALDRVFRQIASQAKKEGHAAMVIPAIGTFYIRRGIASVQFQESLKHDCKGIVKRPLEEQISMRKRYLTADKLKQFDAMSSMSQSVAKSSKQQQCVVDGSAIDWLGNNYGITLPHDSKPAQTLRVSTTKGKPNQQRSVSVSLTNETAILLNGSFPIRNLNNWLQNIGLSPLQLFTEIAHKKAKYATFTSPQDGIENLHLNKDEFISSLTKLGCPLPVAELEYIFMKIDKQSNGFVDYNLFKDTVSSKEEAMKNIQRKLKDIWVKLRLNTQRKSVKDLYSEPEKNLSKEDIIRYISSIEHSLKKENVPIVADTILAGGQTILAGKLAQILSDTFDELQADQNWVVQTQKKIVSSLSSRKEGLASLLNEFISGDQRKTGTVDSNIFKQALKNQRIELNATDINRLFKYQSQENGVQLDYKAFMSGLEHANQMQGVFTNRDSENLQILAKSISQYLSQNGLSYATFFKHILTRDTLHSEDTSKIRVPQFARLIFKYVNAEIKPHLIETLSDIIDIDKDGFIDKFDLETFISRYKNYTLGQTQLKSGSNEGDQAESNKINNIEKLFLSSHIQGPPTAADDINHEEIEELKFNASPFPAKRLGDAEIDELNSQFRKALNDKKLSNYDAFNLLDSNQDGFITLNEIGNLDKILHLSQHQKEGYFAFMDNHTTGMIDYQRFLEVMNKPANFKKEVKEDNWDWQLETLEKIRKWYRGQNIRTEEAFKIADLDFDGNIGKKDLLLFLRDILHIPAEAITPTRLDRLFKLIDQHKRDQIQIGDFQKVLDPQFAITLSKNNLNSTAKSQTQRNRQASMGIHNFQPGDDIQQQSPLKSSTPSLKNSQSSVSFFRSSNLRRSDGFNFTPLSSASQMLLKDSIFEWKKNAKHQIGLFVSKSFPDIRTSFEVVSGHQNRLLYSKFKNWIDENRVLKGFNLTEKLLQQLFSDFDPHKKGYLSEHDWISQLKRYDSTEMILKEITEVATLQFKNSKDAFQAFSNGNKDINFNQFSAQINAQQPRRFKEDELIKVWNRLAGSIGHTINFNDFKEFFYPSSQKTTLVSPYAGSAIRSPFNSTLQLIKYDDSQHTSLNVIDKMKKLIRSSDKSLEEQFLEFDKFNTGFITNLEFRAVMRKLNIGLSTYDIDSVLNVCESVQGGTINWREFCHKIKQTESDVRLVNRAKQRLEKIRKDIYQFLLSPKDAFRQYNENRTGKMSFDEFKNLITQLCLLSSSEIPSLSIIKDIFEFIDIKKDGILDIHEWMETFRRLDMGDTLSSPSGQLQRKTAQGVIQSLQSPKVVDMITKNENLGESAYVAFEKQLFGWECSHQFDVVLQAIGRNRKILLERFKNEHKLVENITYEKAKAIISSVLEQSNIRLSEKNFSILIKFAEKNGVIDYRFMMEVFKQRQLQTSQYPIK